MGQRQKTAGRETRRAKAGRPFVCECKPLPGVALTRDDFTGRVAWFDIKKQFGFVKVAGLRDTFCTWRC